jgi:outer membrane protein
MKNISIYLNIVLFIAVALLYIDRFSGGGDDKNEVSTSKSSGNNEIVYVNMDSLLNGFDLYNESKTQLMQEQQQSEANLSSRFKALQRKAMEFQQKVEKQLVTNAQAQQMQQQLQGEEQNLAQYQKQLELQLAEKSQEANKKIFGKISEYLKKYNKGKGHKIILGNTMGTVVLEADSTLDITQIILKGINEDYQKNGNTEDKTPVKDEK